MSTGCGDLASVMTFYDVRLDDIKKRTNGTHITFITIKNLQTNTVMR
jgi:hypothetical protein